MAAAYPSAYPGDGRGVSGPANAQAAPRPSPQDARKGVEDGPAQQELRAAWRAYNGQFEEGEQGPLSQQPGVPNLNVLSNRVRPIVNTGVDFLFGPALTIAVNDGDADDAPTQAILDAVWGDNDQMMTLLSKAGINGGTYGHVFLKVVPPKLRKVKPGALNPPRLTLLNPENLTIETDPDDADLVMRFIIEYACDDPVTKTPMRKRQIVSRLDPDGDDDTTATGMDMDTTWTIQDFTATGMTGQHWVPVNEPQVWPYELPPIIDWQNFPNPNSHWGQRDVTTGIVALNRQLRMVESNINKIGFLQGHPYLFSINADTGGLRPTPGQIIDLGGPDSDIKAVDGSGDLAQLMAFADMLRADIDEESGIPGVALGRLKDIPRGALSGITMRLLYATALARNEHKRRLYGQGIRQVCQTILLVCGMAMDDVRALDIKLTWQDPLPSDDYAEAQAWQIKTSALGYSQYTAIEETNGNPELEAVRKQDEQQQQVNAFSQGQGMPPMDMGALAQSAQMNDGNDDDDEASSQAAANDGVVNSNSSKSAPQNTTPQRKPPVNHPAAQLARMRMKAVNGKRKADL